MCINIKNVTAEDMAKLSKFVEELMGSQGKEVVEGISESPSALGVLLKVVALSVLAGEDTHLPPEEAVREMSRRAEENLARLTKGEEPKMDRDWAAEEMGLTPEALDEAIKRAAESIQNGGVVPPDVFSPQPGGHNTIQPIQPAPKDDGDDFRPGMYL